ncbi:VENN motif pre-toxin domain-containing protein [Psychrobacter lutiphocae]|uniref:VENN motif pre-toxin domain-containing protein n=1 Tax=Psychrobacter lutiphocae TaxID=540500 RepID=UPI00037C4BF9|nr:VENN motif pre-toxin domain-containing protein [Psychrobacter lutiphocae]
MGCIAASAKNQSCDAGAIGAAVGEMVGDYLVEQGNESNLSVKERQDILNRAKLVAGAVAAVVGANVDTAANSAGVAVENNALNVLEDHCLNWTNCTKEFQDQGATARPTQMYNGKWRLIEYRNKQGKIIGYTAYNTATKEVNFLVRNHEIQQFMNTSPILIENIVGMAKLTESNPAALNQMQMAVMRGDFSNYVRAWEQGLKDPYFVALVSMNAIGSGAGSVASRTFSQNELKQLANMSGMLRTASRSKGNFSIGNATRAEADSMGRAWVGQGYRVSQQNPNVWISKDGMRQYRRPSPKPNSSFATTGIQANFEEFEMLKNVSKQGSISWKKTIMRNGHLNIKD